MTAVDLRQALTGVPHLPRTRAGLAARLRALSAARLAVALFLGGSAQPITAGPEPVEPRLRSEVAPAGLVA